MKELKTDNRKAYTVPAAINQMEKITITQNADKKYARRYGLSAKQKKIMRQFKIEEKDLNGIVNMINKKI